MFIIDRIERLTKDDPVDFLLLMSSIASTWGSVGLAGYGAANAVLDAIAITSQATRGPVRSVAWGPWNVAGGIGDETTARRLQAMGLRLLDPQKCLAHLEHLLTEQSPATSTVVDADWHQLAAVLQPTGIAQMFTRMDSGQPDAPIPDLVDAIRDVDWDEAHKVIRQQLVDELARMLGVGAEQITADGASLSELGFDSLEVASLAATLSRRTGIAITVADLLAVDAAEWDTLLTTRLVGPRTDINDMEARDLNDEDIA